MTTITDQEITSMEAAFGTQEEFITLPENWPLHRVHELQKAFIQLLSKYKEQNAENKRLETMYRVQTIEDTKEIARLRKDLKQLADCDWVITLPDRMDAVRDIAREALR